MRKFRLFLECGWLEIDILQRDIRVTNQRSETAYGLRLKPVNTTPTEKSIWSAGETQQVPFQRLNDRLTDVSVALTTLQRL